MAKQLSIEALRQQLTQLNNLTEAQVNDLLERLKSQKAKLPLEDHSIIDWGISLIQAKLKEEKQLRKEMNAKFNKYLDYELFIAAPGWGSLDLTNPKDEAELLNLIRTELETLVNESYASEDDIEDYTAHFMARLLDLCREHQRDTLYEQLVQKCRSYCIQSAAHFDSANPERASYYRKIVEELKSA